MRKYILASLVVVLVLLIVIKVQNDADQKNRINTQIYTALDEYKKGKSPYIDFTNIDGILWDKVYIFGPYSNCNRIVTALRVNALRGNAFWLECKWSGIERYEDVSLFVFKNGHSIVQYVLYFGVQIDRNNNEGYLLNEAHFVFNDNGRMVWLKDE